MAEETKVKRTRKTRTVKARSAEVKKMIAQTKKMNYIDLQELSIIIIDNLQARKQKQIESLEQQLKALKES